MIIYHQNHMEAYVYKLLTNLDITHPLQLNMFDISDKLGVYLHLYEGSSRGIIDGDEKYIFLNKNLSPPELQQDFGHELYHLLHHAGDQRKMHQLFIQLQEWQANNFMYEFCVPTYMLQRVNLPLDKTDAIKMIVALFNVTPIFAAERLNRYYHRLFANRIAYGGF
ncbi:ImmA/IrrE family metallo-endopeptidase [Sporosarcina sp. USHLN248]|uniref:ImmA/IrrE family metallo-endopeptidase n=1 Tax=Sporosarcina sp. USHLN248 TaxID=3081300 RepID=UPI0030193E37